MIEIDCAATQARELDRRKPKDPPTLQITFQDQKPAIEPPQPWHGNAPAGIAYDLWQEMIAVKKERDILSTKTARIVDDTLEELGKESPAAARAFLAGELPVDWIADHYAAIQALTDKAMALYDRIRHNEQYAQEDPAQPEQQDDYFADALQQKIRRLDDAIYKTKKKLMVGKAKNSARLGMWREKLALDEARRDDLKAQLKRLQYEARGKRSGEG